MFVWTTLVYASDSYVSFAHPLRAESHGHKPQIQVNQALWTIESVARQQGLSSPQIIHLMDYVAGRGKGSELHCWSLVMCHSPAPSFPPILSPSLSPSLPFFLSLSLSPSSLTLSLPLTGIASRCRAVRCLIPMTSVPHSAVLRGLGCLGSVPLSLQQLLLRWLILVFDYLDDRGPLQTLYNVFFYYLQFDELVHKTRPK